MNENYIQGIKKSLTSYYTLLGLDNIEKRIESRIARERSKQIVALLNQHIQNDNLTTLDIGCGWGEMILEFKDWEKAKDIHGIEPDEELYALSSLIHPNIKNASAEVLPYNNDHFDLVLLNDVLEHVNDHKKTLEEILRVMKHKGYLYISFPNYSYPAEAHYKTKALPFSHVLPKSLNSVYLKLQGKNPYFWENYVNPISYAHFLHLLKSVTREQNIQYKLHDYSVKEHKFNFLFGPINAKFVIQITK